MKRRELIKGAAWSHPDLNQMGAVNGSSHRFLMFPDRKYSSRLALNRLLTAAGLYHYRWLN
jgi:hypothetical protein